MGICYLFWCYVFKFGEKVYVRSINFLKRCLVNEDFVFDYLFFFFVVGIFSFFGREVFGEAEWFYLIRIVYGFLRDVDNVGCR